MFGGPGHGQRVNVVQLAVRAWAPAGVLVTLSILKELPLASFLRSRNRAVVSHGDESQLS